jgi:hypothetical protein
MGLLNTSYCKLRYWFWGVAPPPIAECMYEMEICIPYQAQCGPEGSRRFRLPDFMTFGTWMWWGCQLHIPAAFTPRKCSWYRFSLVDPTAMVRSEGSMSLKNPVTPPGIDPGTFRLVAQCLNHYATAGPNDNVMFMYSYRYVCSVLYILFSSCQLVLFGYPDWGFSVTFPQL